MPGGCGARRVRCAEAMYASVSGHSAGSSKHYSSGKSRSGRQPRSLYRRLVNLVTQYLTGVQFISGEVTQYLTGVQFVSGEVTQYLTGVQFISSEVTQYLTGVHGHPVPDRSTVHIYWVSAE